MSNRAAAAAIITIVLATAALAAGTWWSLGNLVPPTRTPTVPQRPGTPTQPPAQPASPTRPPAVLATPQAVVATAPLHLRAGPGVRYPVTGYLEAGRPAGVVAECIDGWARLPAGWARSRYLDPDHCSDTD